MNQLRNKSSLPGTSLFIVKWQLHSNKRNEITGQYDLIENETGNLISPSTESEMRVLQSRFNQKSINKGLDWFEAREATTNLPGLVIKPTGQME